MRGSLGEQIGEGGAAGVHAWAPGQVVKLFKAGVPRHVAWWEARMTRASSPPASRRRRCSTSVMTPPCAKYLPSSLEPADAAQSGKRGAE